MHVALCFFVWYVLIICAYVLPLISDKTVNFLPFVFAPRTAMKHDHRLECNLSSYARSWQFSWVHRSVNSLVLPSYPVPPNSSFVDPPLDSFYIFHRNRDGCAWWVVVCKMRGLRGRTSCWRSTCGLLAVVLNPVDRQTGPPSTCRCTHPHVCDVRLFRRRLTRDPPASTVYAA